jgi:copper(I)-binding protein
MGMAWHGLGTLLALALAGCAGVPPGVVRQGQIRIDHMVIPAADAIGTEVAAYAGFDNLGVTDRLLGMACECAESVELHLVVREAGKVSMTNTFPLTLPGGVRTEVKPPGMPLHFMLIGTKRRFAAGDRVTMRLRFERAGTVEAVFTVGANSVDGWAAWPGR